MRILQLCNRYHPFLGGVETVVKSLSEGLVNKGFNVTVACFAHAKSQKRSEKINGVSVFRLDPCNALRSTRYGPVLFLQKHAQDFDIIHLHIPSVFMESACVFLPKNVKLCVTWHAEDKFPEFSFYPLINKYILEQSKIITVSAENNIACSSTLKGFREKCRIIPFGINTDLFKKKTGDAQIVKKIKKKFGKYILFVGRLDKVKGLKFLITAMKKINAGLVIVGAGSLRKKIRIQAQRLGVAGKVIFAGAIDNRKIGAFYHGSEMLVLPSIYKETFGVVQLEAMACAKPCVVSRLDSGINLIQKDGITGYYVTPKDVNDLAKKINALLADPAKSIAMGKAALLRVKKYFTLDRMIREYEKLYYSL